jgi:hypothetical protein
MTTHKAIRFTFPILFLSLLYLLLTAGQCHAQSAWIFARDMQPVGSGCTKVNTGKSWVMRCSSSGFFSFDYHFPGWANGLWGYRIHYSTPTGTGICNWGVDSCFFSNDGVRDCAKLFSDASGDRHSFAQTASVARTAGKVYIQQMTNRIVSGTITAATNFQQERPDATACSAALCGDKVGIFVVGQGTATTYATCDLLWIELLPMSP